MKHKKHAKEQTDDTGLQSYDEFLMTEYNNIAQAHFTSIATISAFFRYYLLIISLPLSVLLGSYKLAGNDLPLSRSFAIICSIVLYVVGLCVMIYISNLRFDAILYARVVNGIRGYFASKSPSDTTALVLPTTVTDPSFYEPMYFVPVIYTFAFVNTVTPVLCLWWVWLHYIPASIGVLYTIFLFIISVAAHHGIYYGFSRYWSRLWQSQRAH